MLGKRERGEVYIAVENIQENELSILVWGVNFQNFLVIM